MVFAPRRSVKISMCCTLKQKKRTAKVNVLLCRYECTDPSQATKAITEPQAGFDFRFEVLLRKFWTIPGLLSQVTGIACSEIIGASLRFVYKLMCRKHTHIKNLIKLVKLFSSSVYLIVTHDIILIGWTVVIFLAAYLHDI